jgi:hypothetical protein
MRGIKQHSKANQSQKVKQIVKQNRKGGGSLHNNTENRSYFGVPGAIRTLDPLLRRQPLYPAELQGRTDFFKNVA